MNLGHPPDDTGLPISARELVNQLRALDEKLPEALQAKLLAAGSAIVPDLIAILEEALPDGEIDHRWAPAHAAKLLGMLGAVQAVPVLVRMMEKYDFMNAYHREAAEALVGLGKPAIDACLAAYPATNSEDIHTNIAFVLSRSAVKDERSYQTLLDFFEDSRELGAVYLGDYSDPRAIAVLSQAFDTLPVDEQDDSIAGNHVFVELRSSIELLGGQLTAAQREKADRADAPRRRFAAQMQEAMRRIAAREHIEQASPVPSEIAGPATQKQHKLGRNEPCWCGSGKKYKKCHLGTN